MFLLDVKEAASTGEDVLYLLRLQDLAVDTTLGAPEHRTPLMVVAIHGQHEMAKQLHPLQPTQFGHYLRWLAFSFSAVAGFSLVLCLGHID